MLFLQMTFADRTCFDCSNVQEFVALADQYRIFEKSISCVEAMNVAAADIDAARFQWHISRSNNILSWRLEADFKRRYRFLPGYHAYSVRAP